MSPNGVWMAISFDSFIFATSASLSFWIPYLFIYLLGKSTDKTDSLNFVHSGVEARRPLMLPAGGQGVAGVGRE